MVEISVQDVRRVLDLLLEWVQDQDGVIRVEAEEFWFVPGAEAYDPYREPSDLTMGTVSESWERLQQVLSDPDLAIDYAFVWLSDVLRAIGDRAPR